MPSRFSEIPCIPTSCEAPHSRGDITIEKKIERFSFTGSTHFYVIASAHVPTWSSSEHTQRIKIFKLLCIQAP